MDGFCRPAVAVTAALTAGFAIRVTGEDCELEATGVDAAVALGASD